MISEWEKKDLKRRMDNLHPHVRDAVKLVVLRGLSPYAAAKQLNKKYGYHSYFTAKRVNKYLDRGLRHLRDGRPKPERGE